MNYSMLNTVGIELEFNDIPFEDAHDLAPTGWHVDDDGSCRTHRQVINGIELLGAPELVRRNFREVKYGAEFVSPPVELDGNGYNKVFKQIAGLLREMSVNYREQVSTLTSVHVHVHTGTPPLNVMRNLIWLWQGLEAPLYRLAVAEHAKHRGILHHSYMYCRPLSAPQIVKDITGGWYYAYDLDKLMSHARTTQEFVSGLCRADQQPNKWMPYRYYGINFANYFNEKGTTEFRIFNQTMQLGVIRAWVELCVALVRVAYMDRRVSALSPFPLGERRPMGGHPFKFTHLQDIIPLSLISDESWDTLYRLWNTSTWQEGAEPQLNHLCRKFDRRVAMSELRRPTRPKTVPITTVDALWEKYDFEH
jgi:hypothetical protein